MNSQKLKKAFLLTALSTVLSATAFSQGGFAATMQPFSDLLNPAVNYTISVKNLDTDNTSLFVNHFADTVKKGVVTDVKDTDISFIQFDLSGIKDGSIINSAIFSITGQGSGNGLIRAYHVSDDWVSSLTASNVKTALSALRSGSEIGSALVHDYETYFANFQLAKTINSGDKLYSIVLLADQNTNATFDSYIKDDDSTYETGPKFAIDGETPVPEPSSMVLGLMGLGSMFGFRRRQA